MQKKGRYYQGIYKVKNPKKYKGDPYNVIYRSSWEKKLFQWLDDNEFVIEWCSEEIVIPYISPVDGKYHRYFPDCYATIQQSSGKNVTYLIEVKPFAQTQEPQTKRKITKNYINEVCTWGVNSAKWKAAKEYCRHRNWEFKILTENQLFKK